LELENRETGTGPVCTDNGEGGRSESSRNRESTAFDREKSRKKLAFESSTSRIEKTAEKSSAWKHPDSLEPGSQGATGDCFGAGWISGVAGRRGSSSRFGREIDRSTVGENQKRVLQLSQPTKKQDVTI
jgi:hypothetical protein